MLFAGKLIQLPMDILAEVYHFLSPNDFMSFARSCHFLWNILRSGCFAIPFEYARGACSKVEITGDILGKPPGSNSRLQPGPECQFIAESLLGHRSSVSVERHEQTNSHYFVIVDKEVARPAASKVALFCGPF